MAKTPLTLDRLKTGKFILNVESLGLSPEQFFRLCGDNPGLRLELTDQKEIIVIPPMGSKTVWK
jgi:Uma2 family endonuclease